LSNLQKTGKTMPYIENKHFSLIVFLIWTVLLQWLGAIIYVIYFNYFKKEE